MRIGELAALVGVSTRTVRHYHHVGVLPEPARAGNGYREYELADAVLLVRARRLTELGLTLEEVADVLADDRGRDLGEILAEVDADLARQEADLREQRRRVETLRSRLTDTPRDVADSIDEPGLLAYLDAVRRAGAHGPALDRDRQLLSLIGGPDGTASTASTASTDGADLGALLAAIGDDPSAAARAAAIYARFDALAAGAAPAREVVEDLAADILAGVPPELIDRAAGAGPLAPAHLALMNQGLSPAQQAVVTAVIRRLSRPAG
mgnify:CR=1 FL=1|jgi:DNA-binding transcriptional MerR regulator